MPIYEYRCTNCGHELEALQKFTEPALIECPACHKAALAKLVSAAGFQLKGSGWYATDFRNGSKPAAKEAAGDAKADAKSDAKTDAKAAPAEAPAADTKAESKPDAPASTTPTPSAG